MSACSKKEQHFFSSFHSLTCNPILSIWHRKELFLFFFEQSIFFTNSFITHRERDTGTDFTSERKKRKRQSKKEIKKKISIFFKHMLQFNPVTDLYSSRMG